MRKLCLLFASAHTQPHQHSSNGLEGNDGSVRSRHIECSRIYGQCNAGVVVWILDVAGFTLARLAETKDHSVCSLYQQTDDGAVSEEHSSVVPWKCFLGLFMLHLSLISRRPGLDGGNFFDFGCGVTGIREIET